MVILHNIGVCPIYFETHISDVISVAAAADNNNHDDGIGQCLPGSFSSSGLESCETCHVGYYQPHYGETLCFPCPSGMTTWRRGTRQLDQCRGLSDTVI